MILNCYQFEFLRESRGILQILEAATAKWMNNIPKNRALKVYEVFQLILCNVAKHCRAEMHIKMISIIFFLTFPCIRNVKLDESIRWQVTFWARIKFSLVPSNRDLLTFALICIIIIRVNTNILSGILLFYDLYSYTARDTVIFVSHTPKFWFQKSVDERDLWRHFLSYCWVTKSLPKLFGCAT